MADSEQSKDNEPWPRLAMAIFLTMVFSSLILLIWPYFGGWELWQSVTMNSKGVVTAVQQDISVVIRNLGLLIISLAALIFAAWRSIIANRQAETAAHQLNLARQGQETDRFQRAADMLQSERRSIRIAGIMALAEISKRAPEEYLETIISMLATFIGEQSPRIKERDSNPREEHMPPDIVEALRVLSAASIRDDQKPLVVVELSDIDFSSWTLPLGDCCEFKFLRCLFQESEINYSIFSYMFAEKCDFRGAKFKNSEFIYSAFFDCELDNASFDLCKFLEVDFHSSDFVRTIFFDVSFENTNFDSCDITLASFDALPGGDDYDFTDCVYFESEQTRAEGRDNKPKGLKESILNELRPTGF